ncbi:hypothetical protein RF11_10008 [Thelohanellus kitauei]|uniref:Uncharacterized protein n=1 Tax=Thelohanellus kitauei TaxID=669202 RepID=A0A0C2MAZ7_THEKT|nr:hypothetical protein RF11_10008 [Thelohanellus kitauei]
MLDYHTHIPKANRRSTRTSSATTRNSCYVTGLVPWTSERSQTSCCLKFYTSHACLGAGRQVNYQELFREGQVHYRGDLNWGTGCGADRDLGTSVCSEKAAR